MLDAVYERTADQIATCIDMLLSHSNSCSSAARSSRPRSTGSAKKPKAGFSDCLMLEVARTAGHLPFGTFDKALARREGASLLA